MSRLLLPFRRLRWQLTLSYILITLIAALTLEVATTAAGVIAPPKMVLATPAEILVNAMTFTEAPQLAPYLEQNPPDQHGLAVWAAIWAPGFTFSKLGFKDGFANAAGSSSQIPAGSDGARNTAVVIVGPDGQVLASASTATSPIGELVASPQAQAALHTALRTGKLLFQSATLADGRTVAAVPVVGYDRGPVLGALLVAASIVPGPPPPALGPFPIEQIAGALKSVLPSALVLVILASIVGTLFGILASRGITRRLGRITLAADAWSRGEFQATVRNTGRDELGQLATDLNLMAEQLQHLLATRQELAVVEERHRLARDLHDSVKQQMFVITMLVGAARASVAGNAEAERTLSDAEHLAGQTQQELTAMIRALRPVALANQGLGAALRELIDDWSQQTGITAVADIGCEAATTVAAEQALFRVTQEALANVARHSGATSVDVRLIADQLETLTLSIQDNGRGFDLTQRNGGLGLSSMRERVEGLGGTLLVYSAASGTRVEARLRAALREAAAAQ
jgi:two-component system, NarL family, sensor histidine kinase LiaS